VPLLRNMAREERMTRAALRLVAGGLVLLVAMAVGAAVGDVASGILLLVLFYCLSRGSAGHWSQRL